MIPSYGLCELLEYSHVADGKSPHSHDTTHYPVKNGTWCTLFCLKITGTISFRNTFNSEHYVDLFHELLAHLTEEDIAPKNVSKKTVEHFIQHRQLCQSYACCSEIK
jgi:hypothetical protein